MGSENNVVTMDKECKFFCFTIYLPWNPYEALLSSISDILLVSEASQLSAGLSRMFSVLLLDLKIKFNDFKKVRKKFK